MGAGSGPGSRGSPHRPEDLKGARPVGGALGPGRPPPLRPAGGRGAAARVAAPAAPPLGRVSARRSEGLRAVRRVAEAAGRGPGAVRHRSGGMRAAHPSAVPAGPPAGAEPAAGSAASRRWSPPRRPPTQRHQRAAVRDHPAGRPVALDCRHRIPRAPPAAAQPRQAVPDPSPPAPPAPSRGSRSVPDRQPAHHPAGGQGPGAGLPVAPPGRRRAHLAGGRGRWAGPLGVAAGPGGCRRRRRGRRRTGPLGRRDREGLRGWAGPERRRDLEGPLFPLGEARWHDPRGRPPVWRRTTRRWARVVDEMVPGRVGRTERAGRPREGGRRAAPAPPPVPVREQPAELPEQPTFLAPYRHRPRLSARLVKRWTVRSPPTRPNGRARLRVGIDHWARLNLGVRPRPPSDPAHLRSQGPGRSPPSGPGPSPDRWARVAVNIRTLLTLDPRTRRILHSWAVVLQLRNRVGLRLRAQVVLGARAGRGIGRPDRLVRRRSISVALPRPTRRGLVGRDRGPGRRGGRRGASGTRGRAGRSGRVARSRMLAAGRRAPAAAPASGSRRPPARTTWAPDPSRPSRSFPRDGGGRIRRLPWGVSPRSSVGGWRVRRLWGRGVGRGRVGVRWRGRPGRLGWFRAIGFEAPWPGGGVGRSVHASSLVRPPGRASGPAYRGGALPRQPSTTWEGPIPPTAAEG